jgi:hypothetical protein
MKSPETFWWGSFSFVARFSGSFGPIVSIAIPHWFLLGLSSLLLLPAGLHWRMRKTHAAPSGGGRA